MLCELAIRTALTLAFDYIIRRTIYYTRRVDQETRQSQYCARSRCDLSSIRTPADGQTVVFGPPFPRTRLHRRQSQNFSSFVFSTGTLYSRRPLSRVCTTARVRNNGSPVYYIIIICV